MTETGSSRGRERHRSVSFFFGRSFFFFLIRRIIARQIPVLLAALIARSTPHSAEEIERSRIIEAVLVPRGVQQPFLEAEKRNKKEAIDFSLLRKGRTELLLPPPPQRRRQHRKCRRDGGAFPCPFRLNSRSKGGAVSNFHEGVVGGAFKGQAARRTTGVCNGSPEKRHELFSSSRAFWLLLPKSLLFLSH